METKEITLRELIEKISLKWKWIAFSIFITLLISIVILTFFNQTSFSGNIGLRLEVKEIFDTTYGPYKKTQSTNTLMQLPNNLELIDFLNDKSKMSGTYAITLIDDYTFLIGYTSQNEKETKDALENIRKYYGDFVDYTLQKDAISNFKEIFELALEKERILLENNEILSTEYSTLIKSTEKSINNSIINPAFETLTKEITLLEIARIKNIQRIKEINNSLESLDSFHYNDFNSFIFGTKKLNPVSLDIGISSDIEFSENLNYNPKVLIPISIVSGLMFGVALILFVNYWRSGRII